ncbi:transglutaminase family protein [Panacibacter sp. DH6]|uniref:Transglutaminase family protein n=1 Tax=Panacibacter microcysteis TaxID=2793269 RepID=A0A931E7A0_9BACT|nr:transglutaminase family protein [Panacibacter microcysteis]MBG9376731.1 transglutaminase family protein [Panacibacter microcysteis]
MPVFKIHHITRYEYDRQVRESINEIKIFPYRCDEQETRSQQVTVSTNPDIEYFTDYWGNLTGVFNVLPLHADLVIESRLVVSTQDNPARQMPYNTGFTELQKDKQHNIRLIELSQSDAIQNQAAIEAICAAITQNTNSIAGIAEKCAAYIFHHFAYTKGITNIETTVDEILAHKGGVCQDFAHLMLQILNTLHIPARYVSGYICPNKSGLRGAGATHAWVDVYVPGYGWAGIDPTNNIWVSNNHIKLAVGRHFNDCSPIRGTFKGPAKQKLSVYVSVGYEDGHIFEEINNVKMEVSPANPKVEVTDHTIAGQQQQ